MIAGALVFIELIHRAWLVVWFALGATAAALAAQFLPDLVPQVAIFFGISGASLAIFVYYRHLQESKQPPATVLPEGRKVKCTEPINDSSGLITLDGVPYKARLEEGIGPVQPDEWVEIAGFDADELTAIVRQTHQERP